MNVFKQIKELIRAVKFEFCQFYFILQRALQRKVEDTYFMAFKFIYGC